MTELVIVGKQTMDYISGKGIDPFIWLGRGDRPLTLVDVVYNWIINMVMIQ
jgi:hypothetical protein